MKKMYKFGLHPIIKILILVIITTMAFIPSFISFRWILLMIEIILARIIDLHWYEVKGFFKSIILGTSWLIFLYYLIDFNWFGALFLYINYVTTIIPLFLASFIFWKSTPPRELIYGLRKLGIPKTISFALMISLNFLPFMMERIRIIIAHQEARGYKVNPFKLGPIFVPALLNLLDLSMNLALSLEGRGFEL